MSRTPPLSLEIFFVRHVVSELKSGSQLFSLSLSPLANVNKAGARVSE